MKDKGKIICVVLAAVCAIAVVVIVLYRKDVIHFGGEVSDGKAVGTYAYPEGQMSLVLNSDHTFVFRRGNYTPTTGKYTCKMSSDGSTATVTFQVSGEYYGYDGAIIYFNDKNTYLTPTTNGHPDITVAMKKI